MKKPTIDDFWVDPPEDDSWLYSGYWDLCVIWHTGSGEFWKVGSTFWPLFLSPPAS